MEGDHVQHPISMRDPVAKQKMFSSLFSRGSKKSRQAKKLGVAGIALALTGPVLAPVAASAQQQNEIVLSVDFDGTAAFSAADPLDDGAGAHTPGLDLNANNSVVRTYDQVQYRIDWNVNEVDGTTTTLRMTLPEGMAWLEDATTVSGVPSGCLDDGSSSITGLDGRELVCNTDAEHEGSNGAIHPRALVNGLLDGTALNVTASIETDQLPPVVSNPITTIVSARPAGDWVKGEPIKDADSGDIIAYEPDEMYWDVLGTDGITNGRLFVWNLRLEPAGGLKGSEPMDDTIDLELWDHFFDAVPGTSLATPAQMIAATGLNRVPCGGYDGDGAYPFGVTAGVPSSTPAGQTNVGTWTCNDLTGASGGPAYPLVKIDITGQDTSNIAPQNADLSPNNSTLVSGQVAFWAPEDQLQAKPVPRIIVNAITGSETEVLQGQTDVDPILIHGTNGSLPEISEPGNGLAGVSNNSPYEFPTSPPGDPGRSMRHYVHYQNGPYQEVEFTDVEGRTWRTYDTRLTTNGGTGRVVTNGADGVDENSTRWDGDGQTPRGNVLTVVSGVQTITTKSNANLFSSPIHLCVAVDTTHQSVIGMPGTFPVSDVGPSTSANANARTYTINRPTVGGYADTPASSIAQVLTSVEGGHTSVWHPTSVPTVRTDVAELDYVIEVANIASPGNAVGINSVDCNGTSGTWVDAENGDLSGFETGTMADGTPIYGDVTHFRVRTAGNVPWESTTLNTIGNAYASRINLNFQVMVKDDPIAQAADQELFVYAARARGDWDGTGQPPTPSCTNGPAFGADDAIVPVGWCNLDFTDDAAITGGDSTALNDFKNDFDSSVIEFVDVNGKPRLAHADAVYIVEPQLAISKINTDGPSDITANGQTVEFEINPRVVGSSLDAIHDVTVTDTLPATMSFVGFTSQPSQGSCSVAGQTITCTYGNQVGGWGSQGEGRFAFEVLIQDAGADSTLTNTVTVTGNDSQTGDPKTPATARAQAFTGAPFEESGIEKAVSDHITTCFEAPGTIHDLGDCTVIAVDGAMVFTLDVENEGNVDLDNYRVIDVLPHLADATEPAAAGHPITGVALTGDGRTPPSAFTGDLNFLGAVAPAGATILYSADDPTTISRDPAVADSGTTWCDAAAGGTAVAAGLAPAAGTNPCPADLTEVTAVHFDLGTLDKGATELLEVHLETVGATCGDIWTNNFGARTSGLLLPIRSNDVSVMAGFCDPAIDIEKDTNGLDADEPSGAQIAVGDPVTWTYVVENTGDVALADATVSDTPLPAGGINCDVDGDGALDGTNVIPLLVPDQQVTCEATGIATGGPFVNNSSVSGNPVLPDFSDPEVDPSDPTTWPTDPAAYSEPLNPVTGAPALEDPEHEDPSHYTGVEPAIDLEKATNGVDSDTTPGETLVAGDPVTWTYEVENTGTAALVDATVTDVPAPVGGIDCDVDGDGALDGTNVIPLLVPGQSVTCEATGIVTAGPFTNNASVTGDMVTPTADCVCDPTDPTSWPTDPAEYAEYLDPETGEPVSVEDADPSNYTGVDPGIGLEKATNGLDSDEPSGGQIAVGDPVTWTYVVENSGDAALLDATVTDVPLPASGISCDIDGDGVMDGTNVIPIMLPGQSVTCEATGIATGGPFTNNATVSGNVAEPTADCVCDPTDLATWPTDPADYAELLDPETGEPIALVAEDPSHYTGVEPAIDIEKDTNGAQSDVAPGETLVAGQAVTWTYAVENTGTAALANATVTDVDSIGAVVAVVCDIDGDGVMDGTNVIPLLLPGQIVTCESTGTAAPGPYSNNSSVTGDMVTPTDNCVCDPTDPATWPTDPADYAGYVDPATGEPVTVNDEDPSNYTGVEPGVDIEKDTNGEQSDAAPGETLAAGDAITWTYVVTNTGGTALLDATVEDDDPAVTPNCDIDGDGTLDGTNVIPFLAVGGSVTCEATGIAVSGDYKNTATVSGAPALPDFSDPAVDPSDPSTWPTDPEAYTTPTAPDGSPVAPVTDADDSHYTAPPTIGSIGGVVWDDADGDGIQDPNETVHSGALVELLDADGNPVLDENGNPITATTAVDGSYLFPDLPEGEYRIRITAPDGTVLTAGSGGDDDVDGNGITGIITLGGGQDITGIDAGLVPAPVLIPSALAFTGGEASGLVALAAILLGLGWMMLTGTRRRRLEA